MHQKKGMKEKMEGYKEFKQAIEKLMPDFKPVERVAYLLNHRTMIKKYGGNLNMLASYLMEKCNG